jgi:hypothetical protein
MEPVYEKLGFFYLGKRFNLKEKAIKEDLVLYDSKDLTTHAVIIGMTGSGKTGLGIGLIEEALIDHLPVIAIDPKGDLVNLLLNFPDLNAGDFRPWINAQDAVNKGVTPDRYAQEQADLWKKGLEQWGQGPDRIRKLKESAEFSVFTPGSLAGIPVNILRSFSAPPDSLRSDGDLFRERIQTTVTGLLALLGIEADPITSREHILLANIFEKAWSQGTSLDLPGLIHAIQTPPFSRIGVMDLDMVFSPKDRFGLAMRMNNLLAAPGFEAWLQGETLEVSRLLHTPSGKPRVSIFSINHLSDPERMFFISMLLNEILGWVRTQSGTPSLRGILYIDEIFGYLPPVANPPSKPPLLTLLKQARAFGLGIVLATQNPVDLDYKGLSNTGTWFIGRLQTEKDKERLLAGLEGAAPGSGFKRSEMEEILSSLGKRVFLLHNVHDAGPAIFQTRWTLSYLAGPMTRDQIKELAKEKAQNRGPAEGFLEMPKPELQRAEAGVVRTPPAVAPGVQVFYLRGSGAGQGLAYRPAAVGLAEIHYSQSRYNINTSQLIALASPIQGGPIPIDWENSWTVHPDHLDQVPLPGAVYSEIPSSAGKPGAFDQWSKELVRWISRNRPLSIFYSPQAKAVSAVGESEANFRARLAQKSRELRDLEVEKLRRRYAQQFAVLNDRLMRAEQTVAQETDQVKSQKVQTAISFGATILGAFLGRKAVSATSARGVGAGMRSASRISKEKMDVVRAQERLEAIRSQIQELESRLQEDIGRMEMELDPMAGTIEKICIAPKQSDVLLKAFGFVWIPFREKTKGGFAPDWEVH